MTEARGPLIGQSSLRWAQEAGSDWLTAVLASFLRLAVAALQASQTDSLYAEEAMLMPGFVSTAALWMVKGLRLKDWEALAVVPAPR